VRYHLAISIKPLKNPHLTNINSRSNRHSAEMQLIKLRMVTDQHKRHSNPGNLWGLYLKLNGEFRQIGDNIPLESVKCMPCRVTNKASNNTDKQARPPEATVYTMVATVQNVEGSRYTETLMPNGRESISRRVWQVP